MKRHVIFLVVFCIIFLSGKNSDSRSAGWSYDTLSRESELIVIAAPYKQEKIDETTILPEYVYPEIKVKGILTTFVVLGVLKGNWDNKTFVLHHFYLEDSSQPLMRGPSLASFDLKEKYAYLMFLKKESEGQFVAISGQADPAASIKRIGWEGEYFYDEYLDGIIKQKNGI